MAARNRPIPSTGVNNIANNTSINVANGSPTSTIKTVLTNKNGKNYISLCSRNFQNVKLRLGFVGI